jgi:hypothetical protein
MLPKNSYLQKIKREPRNAELFLFLSFLYSKEKEQSCTERALQLLTTCSIQLEQVANFIGHLRNRPDELAEFLKILFVLGHRITSFSETATRLAEARNLQYLISLLDQTFDGLKDQNSNALMAQIAYTKNILGRYSEGKKILEEIILNYGNNQMLSRTLSESLIGMWDLNPNPYSGMDHSILADFVGFSSQAKSNIAQLEVNMVSREGLYPEAVIFLSCDGNYLEKLGIAQALSLKETSPTMGIHFHTMNPSDKSLDLISRLARACPNLYITSSSEVTNYGSENKLIQNTYYASARFCRAASFLLEMEVPVIITDADQVFQKDLIQLVNQSTSSHVVNYDVGIFNYCRDHSLIPLYGKYGASFVIITPTKEGRDYLFQVSSLIEHNLKRGCCWTTDQLALLAVLEAQSRNNLPTRVWEIPHTMITTEWDTQKKAFIWNAAGPLKFQANTYSNEIKRLLENNNFQDLSDLHYT